MENRGTGCSNCLRPGHWSKDCTFPPAATNPIPNPTSNTNNLHKSNTYFSGSSSSSFQKAAGGGFSKPLVEKPVEKPKRVVKKRPKLEPKGLLSNDGLGYILQHFPRSFKYRGRGHEVEDLGNLIGLYTQWHSRLLPYFSFDQFVEKVEQVGATKTVRTTVKGLRERVANGEDPSKLFEPRSHLNEPVEPTPDPENVEEELLDEVLQTGIAGTSHSSSGLATISTAEVPSDCNSSLNKSPSQPSNNVATGSSTDQLSDEQKARIEANRFKALERAAAREKVNNLENHISDVGDSVLETHHDMDVGEELLDEVLQTGIAGTSHSSPGLTTISTAEVPSDCNSSLNKSQNQPSNNVATGSSTDQLSDEQKARIEANRSKALERAAARARLSQAT